MSARVKAAFVVAFVASIAVADEASHRASAERYLAAINFEGDLRLAEADLKRFIEDSTSLNSEYQLSPDERVLFDAYVAEVGALYGEYFDPYDLREDAIRRYMEAFSEEELNGFSEMFESPVGQLYVARMGEVQMAISDKVASDTNEFADRVRELQSAISDRLARGREGSRP